MTRCSLVLAGLAAWSASGAAQRPMPSHAGAAGPAPAASVVARVNGTPITGARLEQAVNALLPMESFHRSVAGDKLAALRRRALQSLIDEELQYQEGIRQNVRVSPSELEAAWKQAAARYGGPAAFDDTLRQSGITRAAARADLQRTVTIDKTFERAVTAQCAVGRDEAARFFAANPDRFVEPEQLHIFAITVGVDPGGGAPAWTAGRARAEQALHELEAGASFAAVAAKYSTDASQAHGGDMGFIHRGSLAERFEQAAHELPVGRFSRVIESLYGYHIIRVSEIRPPQKKAFEEVGANLQKDLTAARCAERKEAWLTGLRARAAVAVADSER